MASHPLLSSPVRNDFAFAENVVVLTGPNMSGKSTMLKALSICVLLAHQGFPVPAQSATMPWFDAVFASVNTSDDLSKGYSQFFAEIQILKDALVAARSGNHCFAVFDELFRGTNGEEAFTLLLATLKGLAGFPGCRFIVSTHIGQLQEALKREQIPVHPLRIASSLVDNAPVFWYKLEPGWSALKLGAILFEYSGLGKLLGVGE